MGVSLVSVEKLHDSLSDIASRVIIDRQSADGRLQTTLIARVAFGHVAADIAVGSFNIF